MRQYEGKGLACAGRRFDVVESFGLVFVQQCGDDHFLNGGGLEVAWIEEKVTLVLQLFDQLLAQVFRLLVVFPDVSHDILPRLDLTHLLLVLLRLLPN